MLLHGAGKRIEVAGTGMGRERLPFRLRLARSGDSGIDVLPSAVGDARETLFVGLISRRVPRLVQAVDE